MLVLKVNQLKKDLEWRTMALHADKEVLERLGSSNQHRGSYDYFSNTHNTSNAEATFVKHKDAKIFENYLKPGMLVSIGKILLSTLR